MNSLSSVLVVTILAYLPPLASLHLNSINRYWRQVYLSSDQSLLKRNIDELFQLKTFHSHLLPHLLQKLQRSSDQDSIHSSPPSKAPALFRSTLNTLITGWNEYLLFHINNDSRGYFRKIYS